jgi:hypothetical protein
VDLNHRPLGYEPFKLSLIWRNLPPFWTQKTCSCWTQLWTQSREGNFTARKHRDGIGDRR